MSKIYAYLIAVITFLGIDFIWLSLMNSRFYRPEIGHLMTDKPNFVAAGGFYLFYVLAACILIIYPALKGGTALVQVFFLSAVLGAAAYGTYDFTGLAVYKDFSVKVAIVDTLWGAMLTSTVATLTVWLVRKIG